MRTKVRYNSKHVMEVKNVLLQHFNTNIKDYLILSIIFVIGVMVGVIIINNSDEQSKAEINGYINSFINTVKDENYEVDKMQLTKISILENMKMVLIIWIAGTTIIGIPLIYVITSYKGFCIGYTISAIVSSLGVWKRNYIFISSIIFTKYNYNTYNFNVKCQCFEVI